MLPTENLDWIWNRKHKDVTRTIPNIVYYVEKIAKKLIFLVEMLKGSTIRIDRVQNDSFGEKYKAPKFKLWGHLKVANLISLQLQNYRWSVVSNITGPDRFWI